MGMMARDDAAAIGPQSRVRALTNPAMKGDPLAMAMEVSAGLEIDTDLPDLGREPERLKPAEVGQVTVDPGAVQVEDDTLGKFTDDL